MKFIKTILLLFTVSICFSQQTKYNIIADSVKISSFDGSGELVIENSTKGVTGGALINIGNGKTAFILLDTSFVDSIFFTSPDSITYVVDGVPRSFQLQYPPADTLYSSFNNEWLGIGDTIYFPPADSIYDANQNTWLSIGDTIALISGGAGGADSFYNNYTQQWLVNEDTIYFPLADTFYNEPTEEWLSIGDSIEHLWQYSSFPNRDTVETIEFLDSSLTLNVDQVNLNDAQIFDNCNSEFSRFRSEFGVLIETNDQYPDAPNFNGPMNPPGTSINVWNERNPNEWSWTRYDGYIDRVSYIPYPPGDPLSFVATNFGAAIVNPTGYINTMKFIGHYIINPYTDEIINANAGAGLFRGECDNTFYYPFMVVGIPNADDGLIYSADATGGMMIYNTAIPKKGGVFSGNKVWNNMGGVFSTINSNFYSPPYCFGGPCPSANGQIMKFNPVTQTITFLPGVPNFGGGTAGENHYTAIAEATNGKLIAYPYNGGYMLEIDPATDTWVQWGISVAGDVLGTRGGWGLVKHPNGMMYSPPFWGNDQVLKVDPIARTLTNVGTDYGALGCTPTNSGWMKGQVHPNGKIYWFPYAESVTSCRDDILEFDPFTETTTLIPLPSYNGNFVAAVVAETGSIYGIPEFTTRNIVRLDIAEPPIYPIPFITSPTFKSN